MTLTPQDVQNKEFLTVRLREGYDMQEVDQFLDEVEAELRRLNQENERLRAEVASAGQAQAAETAAHVDIDAAREAAEQARETDTGLQRAIGDTEDAPQAALTILTHAQTAADNLINEAQAKADELVTDATAKAETLVSDATGRAERLDAETEQSREEFLGTLQLEETALRRTIDDLRAHEREYRSRLVAYHSEQVRRLQEGQPDEADVEAPASPAPMGGVEAAAQKMSSGSDELSTPDDAG
jgi:DivIVA domain-containing protein